MARIKYREVAAFLETGKRQRCGELVMVGDQISSYDVVIATVDRAARVVTLDATKYSRTTSGHQQAVRGQVRMEPGWTLRETNVGETRFCGGGERMRR